MNNNNNNNNVSIPGNIQLALTSLHLEDADQSKKWGKYVILTPDQKLVVARYAATHGTNGAIQQFPALKLKYTSVQGWKKAYTAKKREILREPTVDECGFIGKPKKLPLLGIRLDGLVKQTCADLRTAGVALNGRTLGSVIDAVLAKHNPSLLERNGGAVDPRARGLIASCYRRYGWSKRRCTSSREQKTDSEVEVKVREFLDKTNKIIQDNRIHDALIVNFDETSCQIIPAHNYTMERRWLPTIKIAG